MNNTQRVIEFVMLLKAVNCCVGNWHEEKPKPKKTQEATLQRKLLENATNNYKDIIIWKQTKKNKETFQNVFLVKKCCRAGDSIRKLVRIE